MTRAACLGLRRDLVQFRLRTLMCVLVFTTGCTLTTRVTPDDSKPSSLADVEHASSEEIWRALARAVEARTIDSTSRLAQYVVVLARNGDLTEQDVSAFDAAFPNSTTESRDLTAADISRLTNLKSNMK